MDSETDVQTELLARLMPEASAAVDVLNADGADDVYAVAIIANAGFFSGLGLVSNTVGHLNRTRSLVDDASLSAEYFELSAAEWDRYEWDAFGRTNELLAELEELYYEDELPFEDDGAFAEFMVAMVIDVLRQLDLRRRVASRHAGGLYVGLGFSDPTESEYPLILAVGEALNDQDWSAKLRVLYGNS